MKADLRLSMASYAPIAGVRPMSAAWRTLGLRRKSRNLMVIVVACVLFAGWRITSDDTSVNGRETTRRSWQWSWQSADDQPKPYQTAAVPLSELALNNYCNRTAATGHPARYRSKFRVPGSASRLPLFIAVNLHDNENILVDFIQQLLMLVDFLGPKNVFVSVYESGSSDRTIIYLRTLKYTLTKHDFKHSIVYNGTLKRTEGDHRIDYLAKLRNAAMQPLYDAPPHTYGKVIFLNDIFFCAQDLLELLYQADLHQSDMTCGLDYDYVGSLGFYDTWVNRDREGEMWEKRPMPGMTSVAESNDRLRIGLPIQVSCCWNGAAVLNAEPFYLASTPVRFHRTPSSHMESNDPRWQAANNRYPGAPLYATCSGSEINSLCMDFARRGFKRAVVVPRVKVAYDWGTYTKLQELYPMVEFNAREDETIDFKPAPIVQRCHPMDRINVRDPDGARGWEVV